MARVCPALVAGLMLTAFATLRAQTSYQLSVGGYMQASAASADSNIYNGGYTFYSAAWPLVGDYTRNNNFQSGLYGTWMFPINEPGADAPYTDIEGGLGWWYGNSFKTAMPKFHMGGVAWGNNSWWFANTPGNGSSNGNGKYGVAQLSPALLFPPAGLTLKQGTCGELFGYGYLALPLTKPKSTTAGMAIPTGNHCWTLFLNTGTFKGPLAFFTPYFWSQVAVAQPQYAGNLLDSRWANPNKSLAMETPDSIRTRGTNATDATYARSMPVYYPVDGSGYSLLMHRLSVYNQNTLWNPVDTWLNNGGPAPGGIFDPASTYVQTSNGYAPVWTVKNQGTSIGTLDWSALVTPTGRGPHDVGYQWQTDQMTVIPYGSGSLARVPDYYQGPASPNSSSKWYPLAAADVPEPAATTLANADLSYPFTNSSIVLKTSDPAWTTPGLASGPCYALLGDGTVVTYYWYRFADQPALQKADMTAAEREEIQLVAGKIHREWKHDRDYLAPPTSGTLAELDPGQLVTPPLGMDTGYVPIAWQQDWGGSVVNPGSLKFTTIPTNPVAGQAFSVKVQAQNTGGVAQNVTSATRVQLSVATGNGVLGGTTSGTISSGANSVTISGVTYPAAETMTLRASATCLSPAVSSAITFSNASGQINIYNRPATGIASNQAVLNATVGCPATDATVQVHWGTTNEGINVALWTNSASPGTWSNVTSTDIGHIVTGLAPNTTYYYIFRATNASGTVWSSQVSSFKTLPLAPVITTHPAGATKVAGSPVSFTVTATDAVQYQWFKAGVPLADGGNVSGANTAILRLSSVTTADAGSYRVEVGNLGGSATSDPAVLAVVATATLTWDANTSTANPQDGGGNWIGNNWHNGASNVTWIDYHNAVIGSGGAGGVVHPGMASANNLTFNSFTGTYTIDSSSLTVAGNLLFNASGTAKLNALMSGGGSLTKSGSGTLQFYGLTQNTFSGGTIINNGTLYLGTMIDGISPNIVNPLGTGPVTLNGGTIRFDRVTAANALTVNGGTLYSNNGWGATWSGPVTLNTTATVNATWNMTFNGTISGIGGFTKTGANTLLLSGTNSFTGTNRITAGTLSCSRAAALGTGPLDITSGAMANLNYSGTRVIASLTLGGTTMPPGTYGSTASPAENKNDTYFTSTGTGTVTILSSTTTTLALTSGATPAGPGTPLTFTATVTGSTPTGSVAFHDGATLLGSGTLNGSFQASFTTSSLAIGSHSITVQYAGNASNAPSTSSPLAIQIINSPPPPPTNLLAMPGSNHVALTWTLSTGASSYSVKRSTASGGPYTVIGNPSAASYDDVTAVNGTTYYYFVSAINAAGESANSSQVSATPALVPSTTALVSSPAASGPYGTAVTFTATVTASGGPATGMVTFKDGGMVLGIEALNAGTAAFTTSALTVASHSITATYGGDSTFAGSASAPSAYLVTPISLSITGVTASDKIYDGTATATLTGGALSGGLVGGDTVTVIPGSGTFASVNAGTWQVTATGYTLGGTYAGNYVLSAQPAVPDATITPRPLQLTGTRAYDATALAAAAGLTISNKVAADDLTLTGTASLASKDAGTRAILPPSARVQSATGSTGASASTTINVNLTTSPVAGNTLVAVVSTRGNSTNRVSAINGGGVTWSRVSQATNTNSSSATTEIWVGPNVSSGTTGITITQASLVSAAVVIEYSGILSASPLDQIASATGTDTAVVTGTTPPTTQANELWIGAISIRDGRRTLNAPYGSAFTVVAFSKSGSASGDSTIYALEKIVGTTGAASSGGTLSASDSWAGTIATFKAASLSSLALAGTAAANYTLTGLTGSVAITPKALTITADNQSKTYGQTLAFGSGATQFASSALQNGETIGSVTLTCAGGEAAAGVALYPITPSAATGGSFSATNYAIDYVPGVLTVSPAAATTTLTTSASPATYGDPVTLTATVVPEPDGGAVQFHDNAVALGSPVPLSGGQAQLVTGSLAAGSHSITATYSGSANFTGSTAAAMTQTVDKAMPAITTPPSATEITSGQTLASSTLSGGAASVPGTFAFTAPATAPPVGTAAQSVTFSPADADNYQTATTSVSVTVNPAQTPFEAWAADPAQGLISGVNDGPLDDPDHDGFPNLVEFVLGGTPMLSSPAIQPKLTHPGGNWVFSYDRTHLSKSSTTQVVEYGNDLTGWTPLAIPADSAGAVTITPGASSDHVEVSVPPQSANGFVRLKVSQ
jgi:autotransporter-associated beta strand protein